MARLARFRSNHLTKALTTVTQFNLSSVTAAVVTNNVSGTATYLSLIQGTPLRKAAKSEDAVASGTCVWVTGGI